MKNPLKLLTERKSAILSTLTDLDATREEIADRLAEIAKIEGAPLSEAEALAALDVWLDETATDAIDSLRPGSRFVSRSAASSGVELPIFNQPVEGGIVRDSVRATEILLGTIVAANRAGIRKVFADQIADSLAVRPGMAAADREKALTKAKADLLAVECREELIVRMLEESGTDVARREDAPAALLLATSRSLEKLAA